MNAISKIDSVAHCASSVSRIFRFFRGFFYLFAYFFCFTAVFADSSPLWEYARRHWVPAPYLVTVVHEGRFTKKETVALKMLRQARRKGIVVFDILDFESRDSRVKCGDVKRAKLPYLFLRSPNDISGASILSLPFSEQSVDMILTSPARVELGKRLCADDSAVFLLLDGKNVHENTSAERLLRSELERLEKGESQRAHISFSLLRVSHFREERCLVAIILNSDPELLKVDSPIVVPVFGRGRALPEFYGNGINKYNISDAVETLMAKCGGYHKSQTAGFDILTSTDWTSSMGVVRKPLAKRTLPLISMAVAIRSSEELEIVERGNSVKVPERGRGERLEIAKKTATPRVLLASVVVTASMLILIFSAIIARRLQENSN